MEGAAAALATYLSTWQADLDAWAELAEVYIALGQHRQAAFCIEELLLAVPSASSWHSWYAAVLATVGDVDALRTAQKHYAVRGVQAARQGGTTASSADVCSGSPPIHQTGGHRAV